MCVRKLLFVFAFTLSATAVAEAQTRPVPGYVPPVTVTQTPDYVDDTRGVFVPGHAQYRMKTTMEFDQAVNQLQYQQQAAQNNQDMDMDRLAGDGAGIAQELDRIAGGAEAAGNQPPAYAQPLYAPEMGGEQQPAPQVQHNMPPNMATAGSLPDGGVEIAVGMQQAANVDMHNSLVRLREDRISIRRVLQRMMDQIGASNWTIVWDLAQENAALPDMEISIDAHEPFMNVLNALLARIQSRSGKPMRVIRYDNTRRMVITDSTGARERVSAMGALGVDGATPMITEQVLKEAMVSLHYDEIPLVDALENIVNQAGKGQWRLRVYAGLDQVLKPAHVEEPFSVAMERLLRLFNLKYEIFPGGKLVVVTSSNRFGFGGVQ